MWFYFFIQGNGNRLTVKYTLGLSARCIFNHIQKLPIPVGIAASSERTVATALGQDG